MKKKGWKGSFTVEAAMVVSLTFLILGMLVLTVLFLHDRAVFQGIVCETASVGSNFAVNTERSEEAESVRKGIKAARFMGSRNISSVKNVGDQTSSAEAAAEYPVLGFLFRLLKDGNLQICCNWNCKIINPGKTIRKIRGAELLIDTAWD